MKRLAAAVLAILGMAVSSISLAQGVRFAVGQTWTGTFQGYGTWTVRFTELDTDGDPRGLTSNGPDQRTAGGFDNNGKPAFYLFKNSEGLYCYSSAATAQNGVFNGVITRQVGDGAAEKLGTPCSFAQVNPSQAQGQPAQAQPGQGAGAAAWPPSAQLAAGVGVRLELRQVWNATVSGKDSDGDWTGKASGADGASGTLYSGAIDADTFAFEVSYNGTNEFCVIKKATPSGGAGVYSGSRLFQASKGAQLQDDGNCRVTIGSSQVNQQPAPQQPASASSLKSQLAAGVTLRLELRQLWTATVSGKNSDGDWAGRAVGANGASGNLVGIDGENGSYALVVSYSGSAEVCIFSNPGNGVFAGKRYYLANQNAQLVAEGDCRAVIGNANASQVSPPPTPSGVGVIGTEARALLAVNVPVRVETRQVWTANISGKDNDGDWTGKASGADGKSATLYSYSQRDGTFAFQIAYTSSEFCVLPKSGAEVSAGVYKGTRFFKFDKDAPFQPEGDCRVVIGSAAIAQATQTAQANPQPQPQAQAAAGTALPWPAQINVGQTWRVVITGAQARTFTLTLSGLDSFETPSGTVGAQLISMFPSGSQEAAVIEVVGAPGTPIISCTFKGASSVRGSSLVGGKVQTRVNRGALPVEQPGTCEATLVTQGARVAGPAPATPAPVAQAGTPPVTSAWPLKLEAGQSWRVAVDGLGTWNVTFRILDRDGYPTGDALPSANEPRLNSAFFYFQDDNDMRLILNNDLLRYRCIFERDGINGLTFNGWLYLLNADGKNLDKTAQRCTMNYIGRVTLASLVDPLSGLTLRSSSLKSSAVFERSSR